jgi:hypothetical protein
MVMWETGMRNRHANSLKNRQKLWWEGNVPSQGDIVENQGVQLTIY